MQYLFFAGGGHAEDRSAVVPAPANGGTIERATYFRQTCVRIRAIAAPSEAMQNVLIAARVYVKSRSAILRTPKICRTVEYTVRIS
jgi:hypothetical protein